MGYDNSNRSFPSAFTLDVQEGHPVTDADSTALAANKRGHCIVQNHGPATVYCRWGTVAATADEECYALYPGNSFPFGTEFPSSALHVICKAGLTANVHVQEVTT